MAKNKGGRPRAKDQRRDQFFQVRLTAKELETLKKMAEYQGKGTAGEFLRSLIDQAMERGASAVGAVDQWTRNDSATAN